MKTKSLFSIAARSMFFWTLVIGSTLMMPPEIWADEWSESPAGIPILLYKSGSDKNIRATSKNIQIPNISLATSKVFQTPNISQALHAKAELFYPTEGQSSDGSCWAGLQIDSHDNIYPAAFGSGIGKILPNGTLVNGVNDQDLFEYGGNFAWFDLDEKGGKFYGSSTFNVYVAPFVEGSHDSVLISGLINGQAITLGRGPRAGSLFVTELANQVSRITLSPLRLSVFANGSSFFSYPETIAAAPNGTLYVANFGFTPPRLTKITSAGVPSIFAIGPVSAANKANNRGVIVDKARNVYWSHEHGINKYDAKGNLIGTLPLPPIAHIPPGPPDPGHWGPFGTAFDSKGSLYVVNNYECKTIYKYTFLTSKNQCRNGGWRDFGFKNQGQCIQSVDKHGLGD